MWLFYVALGKSPDLADRWLPAASFRGPDSVFTESFSWLGVAGRVLVLSAWQWYVCGLCCVHLAHVTSRVAAIQAKFHENLDAHQLAFTPHGAPGKLLG